MNDWKSTARSFAGFGAAAMAIVITLGVFPYRQLRTIKETATRITRDTMPCICLMGT